MTDESPWLAEQRRLNDAAKKVLAQAEAECVRLAKRDSGFDHDSALDWLVLATVASDVHSRKAVVDVIKTGLRVTTEAWAEVAEKVALGQMTEEVADAEVAGCVEVAMRDAILTGEWPGILNMDEINSLSTLVDWLAGANDDDEDDDDQ
jgi:hypothetical protein